MNLKKIVQFSMLIIVIFNPTSKCISTLNNQELKNFVMFLHDIGRYWNMTSVYIIHHPRDSRSNYLNIILEELRKKDSYFAKLPHMSITEDSFVRPLYIDNGLSKHSLVLTLMDNFTDPILTLTGKALRHRRHCFTIYTAKWTQTFREYKNFIIELRKLQLRRALIIINGTQLFSVDPYPALRVLNATGMHVSKLFPVEANIRHFKGHQLTGLLLKDVPVTFWYKHTQEGGIILDGLGSDILQQFVSQYSMKLFLIQYSYLTGSDADSIKNSELIYKDIFDISSDFFGINKEEDFDYSYAYVATSRCVMIPTPKPKLLRLTDLMHWTLMFFLLICIVLNEVGWNLYFHLSELQYKDQCLGEVFRSRSYRFISLVCIFLAFPLPSLPLPPMKQIRRGTFFRVMSIYIPIILSGFYTSTLLSTNFTSVLTASYYNVPSASLDDILSSEIPLLVYDAEYDEIVRGFNISRLDFKNIEIDTRNNVNEKRLSLNTSYMYFITKESFKVIDEQQKFLKTKRFILTEVCHGTYPMRMRLRPDSGISEALQMFTLRAWESGNAQFVQSHVFHRAKLHGVMDYLRDTPQTHTNLIALHNQSNMISMMMQILGIGYAVSISAFIVEIYFLKLQQTWSRLKSRLQQTWWRLKNKIHQIWCRPKNRPVRKTHK